MSIPEELFASQLRAVKIPFEREAKIVIGRRYRCDFHIVHAKLVIEIEGGIWVQGRHARGGGLTSMFEKNNLLVIQGFRVLHVSPQQVNSGEALKWVEQALSV